MKCTSLLQIILLTIILVGTVHAKDASDQDIAKSVLDVCIRDGEHALVRWLQETQEQCASGDRKLRRDYQARFCPLLRRKKIAVTLYRAAPVVLVVHPTNPPERSIQVQYYWPLADAILTTGIWNQKDSCYQPGVIHIIPLQTLTRAGNNVLDEKEFMQKATRVLLKDAGNARRK